MSDYTPPLEDVRNHYAYGCGPEHTWAESREDFDRWLAAHDAEKRAEWEAEQGTEEPEWAAERVVETQGADGWARTTWESIGDARRMFPGSKFREMTRQVKAGPWMPVPDTGAES
jgi:hypothetical protein